MIGVAGAMGCEAWASGRELLMRIPMVIATAVSHSDGECVVAAEFARGGDLGPATSKYLVRVA